MRRGLREFLSETAGCDRGMATVCHRLSVTEVNRGVQLAEHGNSSRSMQGFGISRRMIVENLYGQVKGVEAFGRYHFAH